VLFDFFVGADALLYEAGGDFYFFSFFLFFVFH
jgi:hypothetical protein